MRAWASKLNHVRKIIGDQISLCLRAHCEDLRCHCEVDGGWEVMWSGVRFKGISAGAVLRTNCRRAKVVRKPLNEPRWEDFWWIGWRSHLSTWRDGVAISAPSLTSIFSLQFHCHFFSHAPLILITVIAFKHLLPEKWLCSVQAFVKTLRLLTESIV